MSKYTKAQLAAWTLCTLGMLLFCCGLELANNVTWAGPWGVPGGIALCVAGIALAIMSWIYMPKRDAHADAREYVELSASLAKYRASITKYRALLAVLAFSLLTFLFAYLGMSFLGLDNEGLWGTWNAPAQSILVVVGAAMSLLVWLRARQRGARIQARITAASILSSYHRFYFGQHEYQVIDAALIEPVEQEFFESMQPAFEPQGFRHVVDLVNATGRTDAGVRQIHRMLLNRNGTIRITIDQEVTLGQNLPGQPPRPSQGARKRVLATTELSDGRFLVTSRRCDNTTAGAGNAQQAAVPGIEKQELPTDSSLEDFLRLHEHRVQDAVIAGPQIWPVRLDNPDDVQASLHRMQSLLSQHYRKILVLSGPMVDDLINRNSGDKRPRWARYLSEELEALQKCHRCGYNLAGNTTGTCPECGTPVNRFILETRPKSP